MECSEPTATTVAELLSALDRGVAEQVWIELTGDVRAAGPDRDSIVSETVLRAMDADAAALRRARPGTPIRAWAATTARHIRLERARRALPQRAVAERDAEASLPSASAFAGCNQGWSEIDLAALTDLQHAAWRLRLGGRTEREIASELGISRSADRERLRRGLTRLQGTASAINTNRLWPADLLATEEFPPSRLGVLRMRELFRDYAAGLSWKT